MKITGCYLLNFSLILLLSLFCYGQEKVRKIEKRSLKNEPVESGMQKLEIRYSIMSEMEIIEVEKVKFFFDFIVFDDGTAWSRGRLMHRNSNGKWEDTRTLQTENNFKIMAGHKS